MSRSLFRQWPGIAGLALLLSCALPNPAWAGAQGADALVCIAAARAGLSFTATDPPDNSQPADSSGKPTLNIYPTPGPGNWIQLTLEHLSQSPLLVTIHDRLGHILHQQWYVFNPRIVIRFEDTSRILTPGLYSAVVASGPMFLKEKFVVE